MTMCADVILENDSRRKRNRFRLRHLCVGRLDWIRTNDPHHVKVVL